MQVNKISFDSISVIQMEDDVKHTFAKFIFQIKKNAKNCCDSCSKRLRIYFNACKNCNYSICSRDECRLTSEKILCIKDKSISSSPSSIFNKIRKKDTINHYLERYTNLFIHL
jgi:hypothetical protein